MAGNPLAESLGIFNLIRIFDGTLLGFSVGFGAAVSLLVVPLDTMSDKDGGTGSLLSFRSSRVASFSSEDAPSLNALLSGMCAWPLLSDSPPVTVPALSFGFPMPFVSSMVVGGVIELALYGMGLGGTTERRKVL